MSGSSLLTAAVLLPLVAVVLRYRGPSELGLVPDGGALPDVSHPAAAPTRWTRRQAVATAAFWSATFAARDEERCGLEGGPLPELLARDATR